MSVAALRRGVISRPTTDDEISRLMECTVCREWVRVYEAPVRFIVERDYVCGSCLVEVEEEDPPQP